MELQNMDCEGIQYEETTDSRHTSTSGQMFKSLDMEFICSRARQTRHGAKDVLYLHMLASDLEDTYNIP